MKCPSSGFQCVQGCGQVGLRVSCRRRTEQRESDTYVGNSYSPIVFTEPTPDPCPDVSPTPDFSGGGGDFGGGGSSGDF